MKFNLKIARVKCEFEIFSFPRLKDVISMISLFSRKKIPFRYPHWINMENVKRNYRATQTEGKQHQKNFRIAIKLNEWKKEKFFIEIYDASLEEKWKCEENQFHETSWARYLKRTRSQILISAMRDLPSMTFLDHSNTILIKSALRCQKKTMS